LLKRQLAREAETNRIVAAYQLLERSADALNPATLSLIQKIKEPPQTLALVLKAMMIILEAPPRANSGGSFNSAPTPPVTQGKSPPHPWQTIDPSDMHAHMIALDIEAVTSDQLSRVTPVLTTISYEDVRKTFGVAACIWAWVCAVCVICGAPLVVMPTENAAVVSEKRSALGCQLSTQPRTRNGAPITGRPAYTTTLHGPNGSQRAAAVPTGLHAHVSSLAVKKERDATSGMACTGSAGSLAHLTPIKFLGAGAFANVFMCRQKESGQLVALKCTLKSLVLKKKKQRHLLAEKAALSCSPHPNIIRLYAAFADAQYLYFAMELALGGELFALIEEKDTLPEAATKYYAASVTLALGHLHAHGFIYRDLKPENLLLDASGHLKVCDLGLAKQAERTWSVVGTPQYIAPELVFGEGATQASDWWALGVLIFEMATGDLPFASSDGSDAGLFILIKRGFYSWERPPRPDRPRAVNGVDPPSIKMKDLVAGLLRLVVPPPSEALAAATAIAFSAAANGEHSRRPNEQRLRTKRLEEKARVKPLGPARIGSGQNGESEVRLHPWFRGFDYEALKSGLMTAPFVPHLRGSDDDANFGPMDWRGDPVLTSPEYNTASWQELWDEGDW
jgi:serine/threonine protein kinase